MARKFYGLAKLVGHFCKGSNGEIAQTMPGKVSSKAKTVTKETREKALVVCKRDHAIAQVARRWHGKVAAQVPI